MNAKFGIYSCLPLLFTILFAFTIHAAAGDSIPEPLLSPQSEIILIGDGAFIESDQAVPPWQVRLHADHFGSFQGNEDRAILGGFENPFNASYLSIYNTQFADPMVISFGNQPSVMPGKLFVFGETSQNVYLGNRADVGTYNKFGYVVVQDPNNDPKGAMSLSDDQTGHFQMQGQNGLNNGWLGSSTYGPRYGLLSVYNESGIQTGAFFTYPDGSGLDLYNPAGQRRFIAYRTASGYGEVNTYGPAGSRNAVLSELNGSGKGWLGILNGNEITKASFFIDGSGMGVASADIKSFVADHPDEPDKEIWYASLEGPEPGMYIRGTATLLDGKCEISLPDHFRQLAKEGSLTVKVTPHSADTYGLAVINKSTSGIVVAELGGGKGSFSFDWEVKARRAGFDYFEVIRQKENSPPAPDIPIPEASSVPAPSFSTSSSVKSTNK